MSISSAAMSMKLAGLSTMATMAVLAALAGCRQLTKSIEDAASRLLRVLRNTKFRPRFVAGEPVGTEKLVRAYDIKP